MSNKMMKQIIVVLMVLGNYAFAKAQQTPTTNPIYENAITKAQKYASDGNFNLAEAAYKKAKALNPQSTDAAYNLGNLYYENTKKYNASNSYVAAAEAATTKEEKHRIYHNQGNLLLENKEYKKAVEAYKNALRNNPADEETRYNLALAKKEEEKQGGGGGGDDENDKKDDRSKTNKINKEIKMKSLTVKMTVKKTKRKATIKMEMEKAKKRKRENLRMEKMVKEILKSKIKKHRNV
jgi:Ca-activated chloride channel family protein